MQKSILYILFFNALIFLPSVSWANPTEQLRPVYENILQTYPQELEQAQQLGDPLFQLGVLNKAAVAHQYFGEFEQAIALYKQALKLAQQLGDEDIQGSILWNLATIHSKLGDIYGIGFLESQLQGASTPSTRKVILKYLSLAYMQKIDYEKVILLRQEYVDIVRMIGTKEEEIEGLNNLGLAYFANRDYSQAVQVQEQALALAESIQNVMLKGGVLVHLGISYSRTREPEKALQTFEELLAVGEITGNDFQVDQALKALSEYYTLQGNYDRALSLQQKRLTLIRKNNDFALESFALQDLGKIYYWSGDIERAIQLQTQALEILDNGFKQQQQENQIAGDALEFARFSSQALGQEMLGFLLLQTEEFEAAKARFYQAMQGYDAQRNSILSTLNFTNLSEDEIKIFTYDQSTDIYRLLQQIAILEKKPLEALELSEAGRARALVDLLVSKLGTDPNSIATAEPPNIEQIKQIAQRENTTLVTYTVQYEYGRFYQQGPGEWLTSDPLERIATELYVWVISPQGKIEFRQIPLNLNLDELVQKARVFITLTGASRRRLPPGEPLKELHEYLIKPIADLLPQDPQQRVTFIPQDSLLLVPFPALQDQQGTYLVEKHTLMTSPSIQVLDLTRKNRYRNEDRRSDTKPALVVGNPTMPEIELEGGKITVQLEDLPGAEREAEAIATLLNTEPLIGDRATKGAVVSQMQSSTTIHLATHGLLNDMGGLLSSLALAPTTGDRGFLTAKEIAQLSLKAELAVLSACDTGRGTINGDGVIGLSRAFVSAGAEGVLVSLWAIPDQPTVMVMTNFYQQMQQGEDKASALREAMLLTQQKFPEPRNWAAFTLIGVSE
ncbi:CHAT domain-containing protein [Roseofilum sp. BLCC_M154]|uniref:CHAT domain-containing protein n=1 Tax=Roseofilum acuticapitatum BLCC-M154 TaxID=3022444 RepID=A0ABT7AWB8_9CYAN|nr:CHAT domain-containing protein [Roseofilum acuticapitatum]MDJ1171211.1 CHAT domain-containing protein [Roseofilum acuticapitatum BLCC-M154]